MNRIVAGVDGSPASTTAALWAAHEAAMRGVGLTVLHVVHPAPEVWPQLSWPAVAIPAAVAEGQLAEGERILEDTVEVIANTVGTLNPRCITTRLRVGAIAPTLATLGDEASQMVVVGRRGRGGLRRALLGSVSSAVVHAARYPVAVVHQHLSAVQPSGAPIVVGIDGSSASESAIAIAFDEALCRRSDIVAVYSFEHADASETAERLAQTLIAWQARYPDVIVRGVIARDHPADVLLDESRGAQLVVVGGRERGRFTGQLQAAVSTAVIQACRVPVIVAPGPHRRARPNHRRSVH